MSRVYPQLSKADALEEVAKLERLLRAGGTPKPLPDGSLHPRGTFSDYSGVPVDPTHLRTLHRQLSDVVDRVGGQGRDADRRFDVIVGGELVRWFEQDGRRQASNPEIWPYLTLVVLPDLAVRRFGTDKSGRLPRERYLSGRRNIFFRAYLRSWILGDLLEDPDLPLFEDDLVGLVDRNLSADHRVAQFVAEQIRAVRAGEGRRAAVREGLKGLQFELRVTDLASLEDSTARELVEKLFNVESTSVGSG